MKIFDLNEDWDYLIILDACRYDYFAILHRYFFEGVLEKRFSRGIDTPSWCRNTFTGYYRDVIYISGNPYINSRMCIKSCDACRRFFKVVDVWDFGWDSELGAVPPWTLTQVSLNYMRRYQGKRFIIHYLQPHAPYISNRFRSVGFPRPRLDKGKVLVSIKGKGDKNFYESLASIIAHLLFKLKLASHPWLVLEKLRVPPVSPMDAVRRVYGVSGLREAYRENLEVVLRYVSVLVDKILKMNPRARVIITADHGEMLGEDGLYSHGIDHPLVRIVPWFKVNAVKKVPRDAEKKVIRLVLKERIKSVTDKLRQNM